MEKNKKENLVSHLEKPLRLLDPKADVVFKKIFGEHPALIKSFLNSILPLPEDRLIKTLTYLSSEQSPRIPSMKNTIVDVKCTDEYDRTFIVEMQMSWSPSFMKRFLFSTSKAYVQQIGRGQPYDTLCPVYGLAIVNTEFEHKTPDWYHHYRLTNVKDIDKALEGLELVFVELPKFKPQTVGHRKMGVLWLRFLQETNEQLEKVPQEFQDNPELALAVDLAQESAYTRQELEAYDLYIDALRVEGTVRADAFAEGEQNMARLLGRRMIEKGHSQEDVAQMTGLSLEIVRQLVKEAALEKKGEN